MADTLEKHRKCAKCNKDLGESEYLQSRSKFMPGGRSIICTNCLQRLVDASQLDEVDKLMQWLDWPFLIDQWSRLYKQVKQNTLSYYAKLIDGNEHYKNLDWTDTNRQWIEAMENGHLAQNLEGVNASWRAEMARKWPSETERTAEDYMYLDDFYNDLLATQNLTTATQRDDAKRLCEVALLANKKIRAGLDAKNEMGIYHNIIKAEGFEPKNAKNIGDFDSIGELATWLEKRGWKPKWHTEPQDSVDFTIKQMQIFTRRLIENEGAIGDQVEDRRQKIRLAEKLEQNGESIKDVEEEEVMKDVVFEGGDELVEELEEDDDDALN